MTITQAIFAAQEGRCFYCFLEFTGGPQGKRHRASRWTRDHLHPAHAGNGAARNIVLACMNCNSKVKCGRAPSESEIVRAAAIHAEALRLLVGYNGFAPAEWTGDRPAQPTKRALDKQFLGIK